MTTLQEYLDQKYPTKEDKEKVEEIDIEKIDREEMSKGYLPYIYFKFKGGKLDLREFKNLKSINVRRVFVKFIKKYLESPITELNVNGLDKLVVLNCFENDISSLNLSGCNSLGALICSDNNLTSVDFLSTLPNPEELAHLIISGNNICSTNIEVFSKFFNLRVLRDRSYKK